MDRNVNFLLDLEAVFAQRLQSGDPSSYVNTMLTGELDRLLKKIGEEAGEVIIAAKNNDTNELLNESADVLFHLMLVLKKQGVGIGDVVTILANRHAP